MGTLLETAALQHCFNMGPFQRAQSFRNGLLQRGSPYGATGSARSLLQHGLSVNCGVSSPPRALHPPWAARVQPVSPWSSPQPAGKSALAPEAPPPSALI